MSEFEREAFTKYRLSGKILKETKEEIRNFVREDIPVIEICEKAESLIRKKGGRPAFPCNVSINEVAAHYTSPPEDKTRIPEKSVVKVDIGAHVDGYVTDTALTVCFNPEYRDLADTVERALDVAIENVRPDIATSKLGGMIEGTIRSRGFKPISNLTGHQVGRYVLHTGTSIPNVAQLSFTKIRLGGVYAIEPFDTVSQAVGRVTNGDESTIFRFVKSRSLKNPYAKLLLKYIEDNFKTLPFAERWLKEVVPGEQGKRAFGELLASKTISNYPVFVEASGKVVAQAEHTVLIVEDGCEVLT